MTTNKDSKKFTAADADWVWTKFLPALGLWIDLYKRNRIVP